MAKTKEQIAKRKREWYLANKGRIDARTYKWRRDNCERYKIHQDKWKLANQDLIKAYNRSLVNRYKRCKNAAKHRNIPFELLFSEYEMLIKDASCTYCRGVLPEMGSGLDRIDNSKGYTITNIATCCTRCNTILGDQTKEEAIKHMQKMLNNMIN